MATYLFLSDDWLDEARAIRAEYEGRGGTIEHSIRMNLVVVEVPFGDGAVHAHVDTSTGELVLDVGHIDPVDLKVTIGYDIARRPAGGGQSPGGPPGLHAGQDQGRGGHRQAHGPPDRLAGPVGRRDGGPDPGHHRIAPARQRAGPGRRLPHAVR